MFKKGVALFLSFICIGILGCKHAESQNRVISERLVVQVNISPMIPKSIKVSPDSKRVAYGALKGNKVVVVVDGKEGKQYDDIKRDSFAEGSLVFSPDSKRVVYGAQEGNKWVVVVDGKEGKQYDFVFPNIIFNSPDNLNYLTRIGESIYLVEEKIE